MKQITKFLIEYKFLFLFAIICAFIGFFWNKIKPLFDNLLSFFTGTPKQSSGIEDYNALQSGVITNTKAKEWADSLHVAMRGFGTDEVTITGILEFLEQYKGAIVPVWSAFGKRKYFLGDSSAFLGQDLNLWQWLDKELGNLGKDKQLKERFRLLLFEFGLV